MKKKLFWVVVLFVFLYCGRCTAQDTTFLSVSSCDSYLLFDSIYDVSGTYFYDLRNTTGTGTIIRLNLTVRDTFYVNTFYDTVCTGEGYYENGFNLSESAIQRLLTENGQGNSMLVQHHFTTIYGCDSLINLYLTCNSHTLGEVVSEDIVCAGERITLSYHGVVTRLGVADTVFLPDGINCAPYGCSYISPITFQSFSEGQTLTNADDILYVRLKLEHSFIGDLYIKLSCPNGNSAVILRKYNAGHSACSNEIPLSEWGWNNSMVNNSSAYFGNPVDDYGGGCTPTAMGNGWNYCWSNNTDPALGYHYANGSGLVYQSVNITNRRVDSTNVAAMSQVYHPDESFSSLVGCPLNGTWSIEIMDGFTVDNGYIFDWELSLNPNLLNLNWVAACNGPFIETTHSSDSVFSVVVAPPVDAVSGYHDYSFIISNDRGCSDTIVRQLFVAPIYDISVYDSVCFGTDYHNYGFSLSADSIHILSTSMPENNYIVRTHTVPSQYGCDSTTTLNLFVMPVHAFSDTVFVCQNQLPFLYEPLDTVFAASTAVGTHIIEANMHNVFNCDSIIKLFLFISPNPDFAFHALPDIICPAILEIMVSASVNLPLNNCSFFWQGDSILSSSDVNATVNVSRLHCYESTTLYLTVTDENSCSSTDSIMITIRDTLPPVSVTPILSMPAMVNECRFFVPEVVASVQNRVLDNCTENDSLRMTQIPDAGTEIFDTTTVTVLVTDKCGNSITINVPITLPSPIQITIDNITQVHCYGESTGNIAIHATGGTGNYSYRWHNSLSEQVGTASTLPAVHADNYSVTVTDENGCTAFSDFTITALHNEMLSGSILQDQQYCYGSLADTIVGTAASGGDMSYYLWEYSLDNALFFPAVGGNNNKNFFPDAVTQTTYYRRSWISDACGSVQSNVIQITVLPVHGDTLFDAICQGYPYVSNGFYLSVDSIRQLLASSQNDTLSENLILENNFGCDSIITLFLTINKTHYDTIYATVCQNNFYDDYDFMIPAEENMLVETKQYERLITTEKGCDSITILFLTVLEVYKNEVYVIACDKYDWNLRQYTQSGDYDATFQSMDGCDSSVTLHLTIYDQKAEIIQHTPDFCEQLYAELSVNSPLSSILWSTGETAQNIIINKSGNYSVTVSNEHCAATDFITINPCDFHLFLPNAITPKNSDNLNDYFQLSEKVANQIIDFEVRIFNRWGELVFKSDSPFFKWEGKYRGTYLPEGLYTYVILLQTEEKRRYVFSGSITLL